jgi:hypothetical protein
MAKFGLVILFFLLAGECNAQNYFVFIDAGNRQPFYVRLDSQFYSSSAEGHIILSRLKDSLYDITIGFPGQTAQEQHYEFGIRGKDQAFELRDHGGDGPALFDLQANEWMRLHTRGNGLDEFRSTGTKKDDAFSRMMAGVVHDTAVLYNTYGMDQTPADDSALAKKPTVIPPVSAQVNPSVATTPAPPATTAASAVPDTAMARHDIDTAVARQDTTTAIATTASTALPISTTPPVPATRDTSLATPAASTTTPETSASVAPTTTPAPLATSTTVTPASPVPLGTSTTAAPPATTTTVPDSATQLYRPIAHQPVTDTTTGQLYHPIAGTTEHKAAPVVGSPGKTPLFRPVAHVTKLSERRLSHSVRLVYADQSQGKKADTIVIIIPVDTGRRTLTRSHGPNANADSPTLSQNTVFRPTTPPGTPPADNARPSNQVDTQHRQVKGAIAYVNSDCHNFANDLDVDKLRAKMLEAVKDDDRITVARKAFKVKCFYTHYIRALSEVFTTDAAKYRFFEAAWPFAADAHFYELSNLLADPVYAGKFRTLTNHP